MWWQVLDIALTCVCSVFCLAGMLFLSLPLLERFLGLGPPKKRKRRKSKP